MSDLVVRSWRLLAVRRDVDKFREVGGLNSDIVGNSTKLFVNRLESSASIENENSFINSSAEMKRSFFTIFPLSLLGFLSL